MHRTGDLLHQLADEHRDLAAASRSLRQRGRELETDTVRRTAARIVEHELAHRLLVHPLLHRETWGQRIFTERREEQLLLAERLRGMLAPGRSASARWAPADGGVDPTEVLDLQLTEHTDREEILDFPHLRHVTTFAELSVLGELRGRLRAVLGDRLAADPSVIDDGRWATTPRRELARLFDLDEDIVIDLPALERAIAAERAGSTT